MAKQNLDELLEQAEEKIEKGEGLDEIEAEHHGREKFKVKSEKVKVEEKIKEKKIGKKGEEGVKDVEETEGGEEKGEIEEKKTKEVKKAAPKKKEKKGKAKVRSQKYQEVKALVEGNKKYDIAEAIELVKKTSYTKFDGNVEIHIRILGKSGKPEQIRGLIQYPHVTGKTEYKTDNTGNLHQIIGKVSADIKSLTENYIALISLLPKEKIASITLCATMGPGVRVSK